jgi:hypothetical protein
MCRLSKKRANKLLVVVSLSGESRRCMVQCGTSGREVFGGPLISGTIARPGLPMDVTAYAMKRATDSPRT